MIWDAVFLETLIVTHLGKSVMLLWNTSAHNCVYWSPVWTFYWILSNRAI